MPTNPTQDQEQEFDTWWLSSKYMQIVRLDLSSRQVALDAWNAALASKQTDQANDA